MLLNIEGQRDKRAEAAVRFSKELIDHGFHPGVAPQFAAYAGGNIPPPEILPCLATYRDCKNLIPNFEPGLFAPYEQQTAQTTTTAPLLPPADSPNPFAADTVSATPPQPPSGPGRRPAQGGTTASPLNAEPATAQHIHELTRMLIETRIENDRLRQNMVPPLVPAEIDKLLHEQPPYSWMSSIAALFKEVSDASPNTAWATDRFSLTVWRILHEELRCRRQGRLSAPGGPLMAPPQAAIQGAMPGPVPPGVLGNPMFMRAAHKPGHCFRCGAYEHWSRDLLNMQQAGNVIATPQGDWMAAGPHVWDMSGPPPGPCRRCGQWHWATQACPAAPTAAPLQLPSTAGAAAPAATPGSDTAIATARLLLAQAGTAH